MRELTIVKVCGMTRPEDAQVAAEAGATAIGLIFHPLSPRAVNVHQARRVADSVPEGVLRVGVFVNQSAERMAAVADEVGLDVLQLHGDESPETAAALAGRRVWKAFRVEPSTHFASLAEYGCEAFVLDAPTAMFGGSGVTFPWTRAREAQRFGKIILAGGLESANVAEAIQQVRPWGVDASSRLERSPGIKDPEKVRAYLAAARACATIGGR